MRIFVTGGAGFIGSHLVDALIATGTHHVTVVDDLSFGRREYVSEAATFIEARIDGNSNAVIDELMRDGAFDVVYHLAGQKNARTSWKDPIVDADANVLGTISLLEACRRHNVKTFIFASTGGVMYSNAIVIPTPETELATPSCPYAVSKRAAEEYCALYRRLGFVNAVSLRFGNIYGPRQDPKGEAGVVALFADAALHGKPMRVFGDGDQTRDYLYVDDAVFALLATLEQIDNLPADQYNVGTEKETSVNALAHAVMEALPSELPPPQLTHVDPVPGDQRRSALATALFRTATGWAPSVSLEEGIHRTVDWFTTNRS